jgi:ABC-type glycerol-3-phosphate transport system substrate-binding protein
MKKRILTLLIIAVLIITAASCGGKNDDSDLPLQGQRTPEPTLEPTATPEERVPITGPERGADGEFIFADSLHGFPLRQSLWEGVELNIWTPWPPNLDDGKWGTYLDFEEYTGATVNYSHIPMMEMQEILLNAYAADMGPDCFRGALFVMPVWVNKNYVAPWSDYIDFYGGPSAANISPVNIEYFSQDGGIYGLSDRMNFIWNMCYLFYSKDVMADAGLEDPLDVFLRGDWTYDVFARYVQRLTYDSGVGYIDRFGYTQWPDDSFWGVIASNGGDAVRNINGRATFTLHHHESVSALNWFFEEIMPYWADINLKDPVAWFDEGVIGFYYNGFHFIPAARMQYGNALSIVPFPRGPMLEEGKLHRTQIERGWTWILSASSRNKEAMSKWWEYQLFPDRTNHVPEERSDRWYMNYVNRQIYDLLESSWVFDVAMETVDGYPSLLSTVLNEGFVWPLENMFETPAKLTAEIAPAAQAYIDDLLGVR